VIFRALSHRADAVQDSHAVQLVDQHLTITQCSLDAGTVLSRNLQAYRTLSAGVDIIRLLSLMLFLKRHVIM